MNSYGTDLTASPVTNQNKQTIAVSNNTNFNGVVQEIITCDWGSRSSLLPAINTAHPTLTGYILTNIEGEQIEGNLCKATLTYTSQYDSLPANTIVEQSSQIEVDIREHPDFSEWSSDWDATNQQFLPSSTKYGITSYITGSTSVTLTEYFSSKPSSRHANIGQTEQPSSEFGAAGNWLIVASTRQQQGYYWIRVTTYLYSSKAWNTDIYQSTT